MASMKLGFTFLLLAFVVLSAQAQSTEQIYNMWKNKALVNKQIKCVLRRGPCDVIGKVLTKILPIALNNNCATCNPTEARIAPVIMSLMRRDYPREWAQIYCMYKKSK